MDITPYVDSLRRDLVAAAEAGGDEARAAAERLALALDPASRLAIMEAVSQAAAEITAEMPSGSVDVRLSGRELDFVVETPDVTAPAPPAPPTAPTPPSGADGEEDGVVRITLRLPESVKAKAEELAAASGHSLNTWLVNTVRNATHGGAINVDIDLSSLPFGAEGFPGRSRGRRKMSGWV
jgi:hypothetical protein